MINFLTTTDISLQLYNISQNKNKRKIEVRKSFNIVTTFAFTQ